MAFSKREPGIKRDSRGARKVPSQIMLPFSGSLTVPCVVDDDQPLRVYYYFEPFFRITGRSMTYCPATRTSELNSPCIVEGVAYPHRTFYVLSAIVLFTFAITI